MTRPVSPSSRVWLQAVNMPQQQQLSQGASQAGHGAPCGRGFGGVSWAHAALPPGTLCGPCRPGWPAGPDRAPCWQEEEERRHQELLQKRREEEQERLRKAAEARRLAEQREQERKREQERLQAER